MTIYGNARFSSKATRASDPARPPGPLHRDLLNILDKITKASAQFKSLRAT